MPKDGPVHLLANEDYLTLLSSHIVLNVLKSACNIFRNEMIKNEKAKKDKPKEMVVYESISWSVDFNRLPAAPKKYKNSQTKSIAIVKKIHSNHSSGKNSNATDNNMQILEILENRKYINLKRWYCISRPQYKYSCGISSLVSCWNYLYSVLGHGNLKPLTQEKAMKILGFSEPYDEIRFGPFTGNVTLMRWFDDLNKHFNVNGVTSYFYKPKGKPKTYGITDEGAKESFKKQLKLDNTAFIYHCYNHYCCPVGYECEPGAPTEVFTKDENFIDWFLIADTSRKYQTMHCVKWEDINNDLNTLSPEYVNIRSIDKSIQMRSNIVPEDKRNNLHCLIIFKKMHSSKVYV